MVDVGILYGYLVFFTDIWSILCALVILLFFGIFFQVLVFCRKIWQTWLRSALFYGKYVY
jgi:hypothetical protein